jgi:tRNA dimethylallyltransferase
VKKDLKELPKRNTPHLMISPDQKTVIIIAGPTAVGKTSVAIQLAKHFHTEIISADSRQCYKEMNIGVARPSSKELSEVPHHFIASHSIQEKVDAMIFEKYALNKLSELFQKQDVVVMVGGTGLYIKAFCEGMDEMPEVPEAIRKAIIENYETNGIDWLQQQLKENDPEFYAKGEIKNPQRMMRALEIKHATGKSIFELRSGNKTQRDFNIIKLGLELSKEELHRNIHARVDKMIEAGLVEEVKALLPFKKLNALQTVGYSEIVEYLDGTISLEKAIENIKTNTRQYAKRQITWFKKDKEMRWFHPSDTERMIHSV